MNQPIGMVKDNFVVCEEKSGEFEDQSALFIARKETRERGTHSGDDRKGGNESLNRGEVYSLKVELRDTYNCTLDVRANFFFRFCINRSS